MRIERRFTVEGRSPYEDIEFRTATSEIRNPDGSVVFRLEFADPSLMLPRVAGRPVYLAMAMDESKMLRLKPQNLLVNLPLAARA